MAQAKYAARFENFFEKLRLNRDQFADMAAFTLQALQQAANGKYSAAAEALKTTSPTTAPPTPASSPARARPAPSHWPRP
ncbi:hypothetical protein GCM10028822_11450 [Hymenobacter terrigena]